MRTRTRTSTYTHTDYGISSEVLIMTSITYWVRANYVKISPFHLYLFTNRSLNRFRSKYSNKNITMTFISIAFIFEGNCEEAVVIATNGSRVRATVKADDGNNNNPERREHISGPNGPVIHRASHPVEGPRKRRSMHHNYPHGSVTSIIRYDFVRCHMYAGVDNKVLYPLAPRASGLKKLLAPKKLLARIFFGRNKHLY